MRDTRKATTCRFCGKRIAVIERGLYRTILVDAEIAYVTADQNGEEFIRPDGSKLKALQFEFDSAMPGEWAYRPHRCRRKA